MCVPPTVQAFEVARQRGVIFGDEQRIAEVHRAAVQRIDARGNAGLVDGCEERDESLCRSPGTGAAATPSSAC